MPCDKCPGIDCYFFSHHDQVCCVEFDRKDINMNKLVATSLEGKFHVFDMRTQHPTKGFASVSEKVIDSGRREPDGCLAHMYGKNVKRLLSLLLFLHLYGTAGNGGTQRFDRFHSWKCLGLCLSSILCGFVTLAKNDTGPARREVWLFVGKC